MSARWAGSAAALLGLLSFAGGATPQSLRISEGPLFTPRDESEMEQRLHDDIDSLTFDHVRGVYRSRHGRRVDTFLDALPFLERRLSLQVRYSTSFFGSRYPSWAVDRDCFYARISDTLSLGLCNLRAHESFGELDAAPPARPRVILCSHYDSDGRLTGPNWHFESDPAPGADDAASGCAAVLELMEQAATLDLPFEVEAELFGGEEFGLLGSRHEVAAARARGDTILAVINFDQLAYAPRLDSLFVVTNQASAWLADSLVRVSRRAWTSGPPLVAVVQKDLVESSDHAPYLIAGYPAVMLVEAPQPLDYNKTTETVADTLGNLRMSAIRRAVELVSLWLREMAAPAVVADSAPAGFADRCRSRGRFPATMAVRDTLRMPPAVGRVLSGCQPAGQWVAVDRLGLGLGNASCRGGSPLLGPGRTLGSYSSAGPLRPGARIALDFERTYPTREAEFGRRFASTVFAWRPDTAAAGFFVGGIVESVDIQGLPGARWDLGVMRNPFVPARGQDGPFAWLNLPVGTLVTAELYDLSGRLLARNDELVRPSYQVGGGYSAQIARYEDLANLASGAYFYRLTLRDGRTSHGRFMLLK